MKVYKCDRCGSYYDHYDDKFAYQVLEKKSIPSTVAGITTSKTSERQLDLCPECHGNLENWLTLNTKYVSV